MVVSKSYEALHLQIWDLLPGFCTKPTDLVQVSYGMSSVGIVGLNSIYSEIKDIYNKRYIMIYYRLCKIYKLILGLL